MAIICLLQQNNKVRSLETAFFFTRICTFYLFYVHQPFLGPPLPLSFAFAEAAAARAAAICFLPVPGGRPLLPGGLLAFSCSLANRSACSDSVRILRGRPRLPGALGIADSGLRGYLRGRPGLRVAVVVVVVVSAEVVEVVFGRPLPLGRTVAMSLLFDV